MNRKTGKPSHPPLVAFKMLLLQHWFNGLSDVEWQCRDRLSFRKFLGVSHTEEIPDSTTLVRFRKRLILSGVMQAVFDAVTVQLEAQQLLLKRGTLVDATIVQSARTPPPKWEDSDAQDTSDPDARWAARNSRATTSIQKSDRAAAPQQVLCRGFYTIHGIIGFSNSAEAAISQRESRQAIPFLYSLAEN